MASADLKAKATKEQNDLANLQEQIANLKAELKEKKKNTPRALSLKVSQKGALSVYGLGRFPVTLYPGQMARLLAIKDEIETFIEENKAYKGRSAGPGGINFVYGDGTREAVTHHSFVPKAGDMYIFPAWLKHWVYPFKSDCTRISVSGNVANAIKIKNLKVDKPV